MNHKGAAKNTGLILGLAVAGLIIWAVTKGGTPGVTPPVPPGQPPLVPPTPPPTTLTVCDTGTTPDVTIKTLEKDTGVALTENTNSYRKAGEQSWTAFRAGTAIANLEPNTEYEFLIGINTTDDWTSNAYGEYFKYAVPCLGAVTKDTTVFQDEAALPNVTFYDTNGDAGFEDVTSGEEPWVRLKFLSTGDRYFGNPALKSMTTLSDNGNWRKAYPNMCCFTMNSTDYDSIIEVETDGVPMNRLSQGPPRVQSTTWSINVSGGETFSSCYEAPVFDDIERQYKLHLNADDSVNPGNSSHNRGVSYGSTVTTLELTDAQLNSTNIGFCYTGNTFVEQDTNDPKWGVEDSEGNLTGSVRPLIFNLALT